LAKRDVTAHVTRLLRQVFLADEDSLFEIADLAIFVRERSEVPSRILVEFFSKLVNSSGTGH
jgi:hypothetical protein